MLKAMDKGEAKSAGYGNGQRLKDHHKGNSVSKSGVRKKRREMSIWAHFKANHIEFFANTFLFESGKVLNA